MKKNMKFIVLFALTITTVLFIPKIVKGKDYVTSFDEMFSTGKFTINTDYEVIDSNSLFNLLSSSVVNNYNVTEYYNSYNDYSNLGLSVSSCNYDDMTCNFSLYRSKNSDNNYSYDEVKKYDNITINLNSNISSYFSFVKNDNSIEINYDDSIFISEEEKNNYIRNYFNNLNKYEDGTSISYNYNEYNKTVTRIDRYNTEVKFVATKKIDNITFNFVDTPFSEDFKKLTDGTLVIKSDTEIKTEILSSYLMNYNFENYSFSLDGNIINNKVYIKMMSYENGSSVEKEKHLVTIVRDENIDRNLFDVVNLGDYVNIPTVLPTDKNHYIQNYLNALRLYQNYEDGSSISYDKQQIYDTDNVIIRYTKKTSNNEIEDIQIHKSVVRFTGYNNTYSEEFTKKIGNELVVNSDTKNESVISAALNYRYSVLNCNSDYSVCDIGLFDDENKTMEIHPVNIKFDNTISDEFRKKFNLKDDNSIDIIKDEDIDFSDTYYYYYDENTNDSYSFTYCTGTHCTLSLKNYYKKKFETHQIKYNEIISKPSKDYLSKVVTSLDVYAGESTGIWSRLSWSGKFSKNNDQNVQAYNCNKSTSTCDVITLNEDKKLEVHKSKVVLKAGKSPEFTNIFPNNKIQLNAVYKDDQDYIFRISMAHLMGKTKTWSYLNNYNNGKGQVVFNDLESHTLDIEFVNGNNEHQEKVNSAITKLDQMPLNVKLVDLEFINNFYYNDENGFFSGNYNSKQLNDEFYNRIKDKHIGYFYVPEGGIGNSFLLGMAGRLALFYDGVAYGITNSIINTNMYNVIYIPDDTENSKESYIKAAQKRVDDYLGKESGVTISYSRVPDPEELEDIDVDLTNHDGNCYKINYSNKEAELLIIKDSSKMQKSTFTAADVNNNVIVSSDNANYPTNTIVSSEKINKNNATYRKLLEKLKVKEAEIIDIDLYSTLIGDIKDFDGTNFNVSLPLDNEKLKNSDLYAYYIDDNGNIEEHPVTLNDFIASFDTTHFSTYIITNKIDKKTLENVSNEISKDENNPNTYDGIYTYIILFLISLIGLVSLYIIKRKTNIHNN